MTTLEKQYRKHTHREHILELPDTYIGSIENCSEELFVVDNESFKEKAINPFNPGFYKLFDELLVNAHDHAIRQRNSDEPVKKIEVEIENNSTIVIRNDGKSIDVAEHPQHKVYIPQMIFSELLTSTNYDKEEKKLVGGKNGYGVKLVNIFAARFVITIVDSTRQLKYTQVFENNMSKIHPPVIKPCKTKSMVEVSWTPDFKRFGWKENVIPEDLLQVLHRRVVDSAMTVGKEVKVTWCGTAIKFRDLASYASWYLPNDATLVAENPQVGWQVAVADNPFDKAFSVSFVNGIWTRSGKHVDDITSQLVSHISGYLEAKKKIKVKPGMIKDSLAIFLNCEIENPSFSSQTKEVLTTKVSCKLDESFLKKVISKLNLVDKLVEQQNVKDNKDNSKTDGKKSSKISGIPKLDDAVYAGTIRSHDCSLILTEGDSAKAMALSGLSQEQRKYYGIYPLKGKVLNVKDTGAKKVEQTEEIANLKKILGLESGKEYKDIKSLRYGKILIMTDQDYDGSHIRGLLINVFHELWHTLFAIPGFITYMATPIVKATKGNKVLPFYTQFEYEEWRKKPESNGWKIKYYKGLGTSTRDEAKEYFKNMNVVNYAYTGQDSDNSIELAFNKQQADDRKDWLKTYSRENIVNKKPGEFLPYQEFVNNDLIHFSNYNLERSIPNLMDGLKTSQRKILYSAFKRNLKSEIRVAQFAGYVSEHSGYHHGEASLNEAIIGMAQDFVGSNNIPFLVPQGQFGTRLEGGKDSASPRYIHTYLQPYIANLFPSDDFDCLTYRDDDGILVEPEWYAPILPMLLVNGCRGIGTGYSTSVPQFNPNTLKEMLLQWLRTGTGLERELVPYYKGFKGTITKDPKGDYIVKGVWKVEKNEMTITELPVGTWTSDFRQSLDKLVSEGSIKDYSDTSTDTDIHVKVKLDKSSESVEKLLTDKIRFTNMHAFNSKCVIQKYDTPNEILIEYANVRLNMYVKRKDNLLTNLLAKLPYHENVVRFIKQQCESAPRPDLRRKTPEECEKLLVDNKFDKIKESFDYLLDLPIKSLTLKNAQKHEKDLEDLKKKIKEIEGTTPKQMWLNDLQVLMI